MNIFKRWNIDTFNSDIVLKEVRHGKQKGAKEITRP